MKTILSFVVLCLHMQLVMSLIKGISIYGLETSLADFVCSWVHPVDYYIQELKTLGFNSFRLPYSYEYVQKGDLSKMDFFMESCNRHGMQVVLDLHRIWNFHQGPDPEEGVTIDQVIDSWKTVLHRYAHYKILVGHNAYNEYQGTNITYLTNYHTRIFNAIEQEFPGRFTYFACGYVWSGNIFNFSLEHLPYHDRIIYSVHKYVFSGSADEADWEESFGTVFPANKLIIGEWGWKQQNENEAAWATRFISYLRKKGIRNTAFWTVAHSGDTDGIYYDDCEYINWPKYDLLKTLWQDRRYLRVAGA